ncbi:MAG TPA: sigma-70 family RNA polymerase sigma factor [Thermoanaerobaculia bacterium]
MATIVLTATTPIDDNRRDRLARLFDSQHRRLYRLALRLAHDEEEARDLVQEAFLRAARDVSRIPAADEQAGPWLVRIVVNLARDRHRRRVVRDTFRRLFVREQHDPTHAIDTKAAVKKAMNALPPRQRAIVALYELEGHGTSEIAKMLNVAEVTVRWHLSAARKRLAILLAPVTETTK